MGPTCTNEADLFRSAMDNDLIDISPDSKDSSDDADRKCGMALMDLSGFHAYYVLGYKGDEDHHYACGWVSTVECVINYEHHSRSAPTR